MKVLLVMLLFICPAVAGEVDIPSTPDFRDALAVHAMNGLLAHHGIELSPDSVARHAYRYADAMLARRAQDER